MATQTGKDPSQDEEFLSQLYKGGELLAAGKVVEAKDHLERAFKLHPKNEKAQNLLGLTYFKLGLFDRAAEIYELLVRENPADPTLRVNLGLVYLKTNNLPRAVKEFETSTDLEPTHKKAHNYLGLALAQSGEYARAREHFVIAGSDAMADKMARAIAAGAKAPVAVEVKPPPSAPKPAPLPEEVVEKHMMPPAPPEPGGKPPVPSFDVLVMPETPATEVLEVTSDEDVPPDAEIIPAEALLKPKTSPPGAGSKLAEAARSMGGAAKPPLPAAGYEDVPPPPSPSSPVGRAMRNDWGAQFGMDEPPAAQGDDMRFAEDEGPAAMPMPEQAVATSEAAVATGAQVPMEVVEAGGRSTETWETMPVVEATAEEMMVEVDTPMSAAAAARASDVALADAAQQGEEPPPPPEEVSAADVIPAGDAVASPEPVADETSMADVMPPEQSMGEQPVGEAPEMPPGLNYTGVPPTVDVPMGDGAEPSAASAAEGEAAAPVEMFPGAESDAYATQEAWPEEGGAPSDELPPPGENPEWLTQAGQDMGGQQGYATETVGSTDEQYASQGEGQYASQGDEQYASQGEEQQQFATGELSAEQPAYATGEHSGSNEQVPITGEVPTSATDLAMQAPTTSQGLTPMATPRLEELGPSAALNFTPGELSGPFNLTPEGLALSVNGELLTRMPGLLAVVGSVDATPELKRSRGRQTDQPFGQGEHQLQRVRGAGVVHLEPGKFTYQAIDLADEGAYVREERVFAFEEAVAFENARLTGQGNIGVDVVHLKGQGKVLLKLDGALKAMAIPPGTPLKVPLARLVGWYGYVSVRVMGFVGQGAVELTGDGYVLLAA